VFQVGLRAFLGSIIKVGSLTVIWPDRRSEKFGSGDPHVTIRVDHPRFARRVLRNPPLGVGETYMDGDFSVEDGTIEDLMDLLFLNMGWGHGHWFLETLNWVQKMGKRLFEHNPVYRSKRNVAHHYDLSDDFYDLFLDSRRQYSCAYFITPDDHLETAQEQKLRHIASKLLLKPGMRVLDVGCGWGGLAMYLAQTAEVHVTGITLSQEQLKVAQDRACEAGLGGRVEFRLQDYREVQERFDRIVSVGMFEHVGTNHYRRFFAKIRDCLEDDGVALLHSIGRADGPSVTNQWIRKYIFPGGYSPALSEVLPAVERSELYATDIEILRLHYAETLKQWLHRLWARRAEVAEIYDERFCRMWEFYFAASEAVFRRGGHIVFQLQLSRQVDTVPITRDYMFDWERSQGEMAVTKQLDKIA